MLGIAMRLLEPGTTMISPFCSTPIMAFVLWIGLTSLSEIVMAMQFECEQSRKIFHVM